MQCTGTREKRFWFLLVSLLFIAPQLYLSAGRHVVGNSYGLSHLDEAQWAFPSPSRSSRSDDCGGQLHMSSERLSNWFQQGVPLLGSAILHPETNETLLLFTKKGWGQKQRNAQEQAMSYRKYHGRNNWHCNGRQARVVGQPGVPRDRLFLLILACPASPIGETEDLYNLTFVNAKNETVLYHNLNGWWKCQTQHHPLTNWLQSTSIDALPQRRKVLGTVVQGEWSQALLRQWTAYHRFFLGINHFIVYVNEDWEEFKGRSSYFEAPDAIIYVPFDLTIGIGHYFQRLHQNDLLYRIKVERTNPSIDWLGIWDVDEFVYLPNSTAETSSMLFDSLLHQKKTEYPDLVGLQMANVFFGDKSSSNAGGATPHRKPALHPSEAVWLCHYTWRRSILPIQTFWQRQKILVQPHHPSALYVNVHHVLTTSDTNLKPNATASAGKSTVSPSKGVYRLDPETELRHHHFKQPDLGPFEEIAIDWGIPRQDSSFRDAFCSSLEKKLEQGLK